MTESFIYQIVSAADLGPLVIVLLCGTIPGSPQHHVQSPPPANRCLLHDSPVRYFVFVFHRICTTVVFSMMVPRTSTMQCNARQQYGKEG